LVILLAGIFFSELFKKLHLPYVLSLIVAGIIIGPWALNLVTLNPSIIFHGIDLSGLNDLSSSGLVDFLGD